MCCKRLIIKYFSWSSEIKYTWIVNIQHWVLTPECLELENESRNKSNLGLPFVGCSTECKCCVHSTALSEPAKAIHNSITNSSSNESISSSNNRNELALECSVYIILIYFTILVNRIFNKPVFTMLQCTTVINNKYT